MDRPMLFMLLLSFGCGGDEESAPVVQPAGCAAGEWRRDDGRCIVAGLPPDMPCPPGEWAREDGSCVPAGVPSDGCGDGFAHDGDRGCNAILPPAPCPAGLMAVPGERTCREVAPCGSGKWGDIPVEPNSEYVDASYAGMDSDGSALKPWTSIQAGIDAAAPGAIVAIAAGSYLEDVYLSGKALRLWGVCPALTEVIGSAAALATLDVRTGATGSEVRGLGLRGDAFGMVLSGSLDVVLERVRVHDNAGRAVNVQNDLGPTSLILRGVLLEQNEQHGLFAVGAEATVEASVIRTTRPDAQGLLGRGVTVQPNAGTGAPATLSVERSLIEQNHDVGVFVAGSEATVEASVVRATQLDGDGVHVRADETTLAPARIVLQRSLIEQNQRTGVHVAGSEAVIEATVVRATQLDAQGLFGRGVNVQVHPTTGAPATLLLGRSLIEQNHEIGVHVSASDATVEATVVRATRPNAQALGGRGVNVQDHPTTGARSTLLLQSSLVEQNEVIGVFVFGSEATVQASIVRMTAPNVLGVAGHGVQAKIDSATGVASTLRLEHSLIEQSYEIGVFVLGSVATVASCEIRDTLANGAGSFGEGIAVVSLLAPASATVTATRVDRSARAAVASWGAHAALGGSVLTCQSFDIDYEAYEGKAATLDDLGNNVCGCPDAQATCVGVSASLEPPQSIEPLAEQ